MELGLKWIGAIENPKVRGNENGDRGRHVAGEDQSEDLWVQGQRAAGVVLAWPSRHERQVQEMWL